MLDEEIETTPGEEIIEEDANVSPLEKAKEYTKELSQIGPTSTKQIENNIKNMLALIDEKDARKIIENSKKISDKLSQHTSAQPVSESKDGAKKSIKELIGEIFPSLSFYPALGIWSMVDKMISSGKGFEALTPEQARLLPVYISLFFGLVGDKIAYNRLKDYISTNDNIDKEINETLRLAGVQLDESIESNLDDAKAFVSSELQNKFGAAIPENDEEKDYIDDLINMATMKYNVPEDSLRNALGLVEEEPIEEPKEPTEEVPGEKIEEV